MVHSRTVQLSVARGLLLLAFAGSVALLLMAFVVPVVTPSNSGVQGVQPRVTIFAYFGFTGLLSELAVMLAVLTVAKLLGFGAVGAGRRRLLLARFLAILLLVGLFPAIAFTHAAGLFAVPTVIAVLLAAWSASEVG